MQGMDSSGHELGTSQLAGHILLPATRGESYRVLTPGCCPPQVCVWYGGRECTGVVERHSGPEDKVTVWLLDQKLQICCKAEEACLAELQGMVPQAPSPEHGAQAQVYRPVSRNIDVPKRCTGSGGGVRAALGWWERGSWGLVAGTVDGRGTE